MTSLLLFSGCMYYKDKVIYVKPVTYPFEIRELPADKQFPIRNDYVEAYKAWKSEMYGTINDLNFQISEYIRLNKKEE